jgi:AmiR/NasT family two-component response regulator
VIGIVWALLAVALIATMVGCTIMLARKFFALVQALADFVSLPAILDGVHRADAEPRSTPAVLRPRSAVAAERDLRRQISHERRQLRRDQRLERARKLLRADVTAREWFSS